MQIACVERNLVSGCTLNPSHILFGIHWKEKHSWNIKSIFPRNRSVQKKPRYFCRGWNQLGTLHFSAETTVFPPTLLVHRWKAFSAQNKLMKCREWQGLATFITVAGCCYYLLWMESFLRRVSFWTCHWFMNCTNRFMIELIFIPLLRPAVDAGRQNSNPSGLGGWGRHWQIDLNVIASKAKQICCENLRG